MKENLLTWTRQRLAVECLTDCHRLQTQIPLYTAHLQPVPRALVRANNIVIYANLGSSLITFCDSSWKIVVFSFLFTTCRLREADTKRNSFAEALDKFLTKEKRYYWCEIHRFPQREVDLVLVAHCEHDVDEKWLTTLQHKKVWTRRISSSTTGNAGANKDGPTHKNLDESTSVRRVRTWRKEWRENLPETKKHSLSPIYGPKDT